MSAGGHYHQHYQQTSPLPSKRQREDSEEKISNIRSLLNDPDSDAMQPATNSSMSINVLTAQHPQQHKHSEARMAQHVKPAYRPSHYNESRQQIAMRSGCLHQQQPLVVQPIASGSFRVQSGSDASVQQQQQRQQRLSQVVMPATGNGTGQSAAPVGFVGHPRTEPDPSSDKLATGDLPPPIREPTDPMDRPRHSILTLVTKVDSANQQPQLHEPGSAVDHFTTHGGTGGETQSPEPIAANGKGAARGDPGVTAFTQGVTRTDVGQSSSDARFRPYPEIGSGSLPDSASHVDDEQSADRLPQAAAEPGRQDDSQTQRRRRRTQACEYCHQKKIKCEGEGTRCINCIKNDIQCIWGQKRKRGPKPKPLSAVLGKTRSRGSRAQRAAKGGKGKPSIIVVTGAPAQALAPSAESDARSQTPATPIRDDQVFESTEYADVDAVPEGLKAPSMHRELQEFFSGKVDLETREAVTMYFDYFYPLCPIFHPSLFIRRVVENDVDPILIDAMKATTARMLSAKTGRFIDGDALAES
ncbi:hypothetical protein EC988_006177, partial [Linderina pennispora]